ncbi:sigma 54-interacting transcriptional regulator [Chondromyces apiculatus]|uniref:Type IV fimbriae expression regulatory protein PilR n=1 Tax=Chondromyces apiculatus DSM 436 TaxID=1192034 RepID=A0A017T4A1_9BACT|nr:sigma 54-interacting transcriptional regulator [Chondromyces apiculatus]EYF03411.1 Type IV fimbriae expression regulatory protein PilR [Chondromyces apiculatus DSM 436]
MGGDETRTLSVAEDEDDGGRPRRPHLFLVLEAHRPLAAPMRLALTAVDEVLFGRGTERRVEREGRRAVVRVDDAWMSSTHARLTRVLRRWVLEDAGSKNGCAVNGQPVRRVEIEDGDVIELGQTFFVLREGLAVEPADPELCDAATLTPAAAGMATLIPALAREYAQVTAIARTRVPVLLSGETGAGKEVMAQAIHALSGRSGAFVAVNCGALPATLVEGELFGHRKGAFSGATEDRPGLVRAADRGTLLLDEIGDLPLGAQAALLRVLQEREVMPVGGTRPVPVDLRVVAATHRPLEKMVAEQRFRADLHARLSGYRVALWPLRERREDLGMLVGTLLRRMGVTGARLHARAARALMRHDFPGNVRELERALEAAVALAGGGPILLEHLPEPVRRSLEAKADTPGEAKADAPGGEEGARREELLALLREHGGNVTAVARAMGKARMQVQRWMKRYGIDPEQFRP